MQALRDQLSSLEGREARLQVSVPPRDGIPVRSNLTCRTD